GSNWALLSDAVPTSTFNLAVGENAQTLFAAAGESGLLLSTDGGQTWEAVSGIPNDGALAVVYSPASGRLYVSTLGEEAGLYVTEDGGQTWTFAGLKGTMLAMAVSPLDPNHIVVVNDAGQVFASRDGGTSWTDK
ncbi:MAG: hypothetical protein L0287_32740, partial [Anaerolineae bacterium]|nr:hypothetical protein [Anaerolineae bacterium]